MSVSPKNVKDVSLTGEFDEYKNSAIQTYIEIATRNVAASVWEEKTDDGVKMLTAHYLVLAGRGGSGGSVTSEKVGDLQTSYGMNSSEKSNLAATSYGQMFLSMMKTLVITPRVVQCP